MLQRKRRSIIPPRTACGSTSRDVRERKPIRVADPVRFRTRGFQLQIGIGGMGNRELVKNQDAWKPHIQASHREPPKQCSVGEPPKYTRRPVEEISEDKEAYRIIIEMPYHQENEIKVDIIADVLSIQSTKPDFNYYQEFLIPLDVLPNNYKQSFQNGILTFSFEKAKKEVRRMSKLNMAVSHRLSQDEALRRIKTLLGETKKQFADKISNLHEEWNGNTGNFSLSAMGFPVSGTLTVKSSEVQLSGHLPFAATFFKGKIASVIRERAEALLA